MPIRIKLPNIQMIRSLFTKLWRLITAPFRLIAKPFVAIRNFIIHEPEAAPLADVIVLVPLRIPPCWSNTSKLCGLTCYDH